MYVCILPYSISDISYSSENNDHTIITVTQYYPTDLESGWKHKIFIYETMSKQVLANFKLRLLRQHFLRLAAAPLCAPCQFVIIRVVCLDLHFLVYKMGIKPFFPLRIFVSIKEIMKHNSIEIYYKTQSIVNIVLWLFINMSHASN